VPKQTTARRIQRSVEIIENVKRHIEDEAVHGESRTILERCQRAVVRERRI
jgi:hypothetical protein